MISVRKALRLQKVSFKMLFIKATAIKKEDSTDNLISLQILETPSCAASSRHPINAQCAVLIPFMEMLSHFIYPSCSIPLPNKRDIHMRTFCCTSR